MSQRWSAAQSYSLTSKLELEAVLRRLSSMEESSDSEKDEEPSEDELVIEAEERRESLVTYMMDMFVDWLHRR